jgi:hypothetical protein
LGEERGWKGARRAVWWMGRCRVALPSLLYSCKFVHGEITLLEVAPQITLYISYWTVFVWCKIVYVYMYMLELQMRISYLAPHKSIVKCFTHRLPDRKHHKSCFFPYGISFPDLYHLYPSTPPPGTSPSPPSAKTAY